MEQSARRSPQGLLVFLRERAALLTVLFCAVLLPLGWGEKDGITAGSCVYLGAVLSVMALFAIWYFRLGRSVADRFLLSVGLVCGLAGGAAVIALSENKIAAIAAAGGAGLVCLLALSLQRKGSNEEVLLSALVLAGILLRFLYVLYTDSTERQHDPGAFTQTAGIGHIGYIEYWYQNGLTLPDFDVRTMWQYYHPPLHYWLSALALRGLTLIGVPYQTAGEAIQILPMLWSSLTVIVCLRLFRALGLRGGPMLAAAAIVCFHPTFILFGGSYNNDMLLMLLVMTSFLQALRWYRDPTWKNILILAVCVGGCVMSKLSGVMVAPAIALLFAAVLIRHIKKPLPYLGQFAVFGVISIPLGIWWQVRNLIAFGVPLTFIPSLDSNSSMYLGDMSVSQRLFDFGGEQLHYVYDAYGFLGAPYYEFNPTLGLIKTALFDECNNSINDLHFPQIASTGPALFWVNLVLFALCTVFFLLMLIRKSRSMDRVQQGALGLLFFVHLINYYIFCFTFPFTCTMNIRYAMPVIPRCALGLGLIMRDAGEKWPAKVFRVLCGALTAAFCLMSTVVYLQVGL
ncbi:MAG: glycosyltransferase family 39 protein [Lachnospiraceae bacterium]|nr:glycosyltransferase family 39 protein [Lachnospiraceae bacterium]